MPNRILILGASGFIGNTLYRELLPYFDVFGTFNTKEGLYGQNQVFFQFNCEEDSLGSILKHVAPNFIISAIKGDAKGQLKVHEELCHYLKLNKCTLVYISTATVFDAKRVYPSYEYDTLLAESNEGKLKIAIEKCIKKLPENKWIIVRLPQVLGVNSPAVINLKQAIKHHATFEVFPNLIISTTTQNKVAQQIHYLINKNLKGIFHLASEDVIHHDELFKEIAKKISHKTPIFKNVYSSNDDRYLAILPKENRFPKNFQITVEQVIEESTLKDEIETLKAI